MKLGYVGNKKGKWYHTLSAGVARHMPDICGNDAVRLLFAKA